MRVQSPVAFSRRSCDHGTAFISGFRLAICPTPVPVLNGQFLLTSGILDLRSRHLRIFRRTHGPNLDPDMPNINFFNQSIFKIAHVFCVVEVPDPSESRSSLFHLRYPALSTSHQRRRTAWYQGGRLRHGIDNGIEGA